MKSCLSSFARRIGKTLSQALALLVLATPIALLPLADTQAKAKNKIAVDLEQALDAASTPKVKWARDLNGSRELQVIVVTDGKDPEMNGLRAEVLQAGGSVHAVFASMNAATVQLKANEVRKLAERNDVVSVSPNREIVRTASTLESITGALASNVRTGSTKTSYSGLDGTGIGIAVPDSGVMKAHEAFFNDSGVRRVKRNVTMLMSATPANWSTGVSNTWSLQPGSSALLKYEADSANDSNSYADAFGHGTHVASVAAGRAKYYSSGTPAMTYSFNPAGE